RPCRGGGGREIFLRPPGHEPARRVGRRVHGRRIPGDVGDQARAHDVVAQLGDVDEHVLGRPGLHDALELPGDRRGSYNVRGLLAEVAAQVRKVVVDTVLPATQVG